MGQHVQLATANGVRVDRIGLYAEMVGWRVARSLARDYKVNGEPKLAEKHGHRALLLQSELFAKLCAATDLTLDELREVLG